MANLFQGLTDDFPKNKIEKLITRITFIGGIFTAISLLSIPTFIIPMLTMIPFAMPIEIIFGKVFGHDDYSKTGNSVIISLSILFIVITYFFL